jgi:hypothetical protein
MLHDRKSSDSRDESRTVQAELPREREPLLAVLEIFEKDIAGKRF